MLSEEHLWWLCYDSKYGGCYCHTHLEPSAPAEASISTGLSSRLEVDYKEPKFQDPQKAKQAERLGMGLGRIR